MRHHRSAALLLAGALCVSLLFSGCSSKPENTPDVQPPESEPTQTVAAQPTQAPDVTTPDADVTTPEDKPSAPAPDDKPGNQVTPAQPAGSKVQAAWEDISKLDLPIFMDMDDEILTALYGIDQADLVEYVGKIPMMNAIATEFFIAQVKPGRMDAVKAGIDSRLADLDATWSTYLPEQLELVRNAKVIINGDYVMMAVTEYPTDAVNSFNAHTK